MPKTCCVVPGCSNRGGHEFPKDPGLRKAWVVAIRRNDADNKSRLWTPTATSLVCADHFLPSDYQHLTKTGW